MESSSQPSAPSKPNIPDKGYANLKKGRISRAGEYYFITMCTADKTPVLNQHAIADIIFTSLEFLESNNKIRLICCLLMPDHLHMVLHQTTHESLDKVMQSFKQFTSRNVNKHLGRTTPLWQTQFYEHRIRKEESLWKIVNYCLENPVRKGMVERVEEYPFQRVYPEKIDEDC